MGNYQFTDIHTHFTLSIKYIPSGVFGFASKWMFKKRSRFNKFTKFLHHLIFWSNKDMFDRVAEIVEQSLLTSEQRLLKILESCDVATTLVMDFYSMNAGTPECSFEQQLNRAIELKEKYKGRVLIFMMLDPNRPDILRLARNYYERIDGWKYYAPLTGSINKHKVIGVILNEMPLPIIMHTTNTTPIYNHKFKKKIANELAHPRYAVNLIEKHKNVNFNFAHLGGENWQHEVVTLCKAYPNVYTDISYTFGKDYEQLELDTREIEHKRLWGTDSPLINTDNFYKVKGTSQMQRNNKTFLSWNGSR